MEASKSKVSAVMLAWVMLITGLCAHWEKAVCFSHPGTGLPRPYSFLYFVVLFYWACASAVFFYVTTDPQALLTGVQDTSMAPMIGNLLTWALVHFLFGCRVTMVYAAVDWCFMTASILLQSVLVLAGYPKGLDMDFQDAHTAVLVGTCLFYFLKWRNTAAAE